MLQHCVLLLRANTSVVEHDNVLPTSPMKGGAYDVHSVGLESTTKMVSC